MRAGLGIVALVGTSGGGCGGAEPPAALDLSELPEGTADRRATAWTWTGKEAGFDGLESVTMVGQEILAVGTVGGEGTLLRFGLEGDLRSTESLSGPAGEMVDPRDVVALGTRAFMVGASGAAGDECWVGEAGGFSVVLPDTVSEAECNALEVEESGLVVVGTVAFPERDTLLAGLGLDGTLQWSRTLDLSPDGSDEIATAVVRAGDGLIVSGAGRTEGALRWHVVGLSAEGTPQWTHAPVPGGSSSWADDLVRLDGGDVWAVGMETTETGEGAWNSVRLGPDGTERWRIRVSVSAFGAASGAAVTEDGTLVATGFQSHGELDSRRRIWTREADGAGVLLWRTLAVDAPSIWDEGRAVAADGAGGVVVAGFVTDPDSLQTGPWLRRYELAR